MGARGQSRSLHLATRQDVEYNRRITRWQHRGESVDRRRRGESVRKRACPLPPLHATRSCTCGDRSAPPRQPTCSAYCAGKVWSVGRAPRCPRFAPHAPPAASVRRRCPRRTQPKRTHRSTHTVGSAPHAATALHGSRLGPRRRRELRPAAARSSSPVTSQAPPHGARGLGSARTRYSARSAALGPRRRRRRRTGPQCHPPRYVLTPEVRRPLPLRLEARRCQLGPL